jgi:hypothetical protein
MSLVHGMLAGADSIDDMDVLRAGSTQLVLGHRVMAPSTLGTFLREFTFGHVRQLDRVLDHALARAWEAGAGPGDGLPLVIDIDSSSGRSTAITSTAPATGTRVSLGITRSSRSARTPARCCTSATANGRRTRSAAWRGSSRSYSPGSVARGTPARSSSRADTGFENHKQFTTLDRHGVQFSIAVKQSKTIRALIDQIPEEGWVTIADYPDSGECQIAETQLKGWRLIVRRTRLLGKQADLFPDWRYHAFATNRTIPTVIADIDHRDHATVELAIRDLKDQALAHFPSGQFAANSAWAVIAALSHNLGRWTSQIGAPNRPVQTARARRRQLLTIPARLTRSSRQWTLRMPARWPWQHDFTTVLDAIRALPART